MLKHLFISHSMKDKCVTKRVLSYLESNGKHCWIAPRDIPSGADWAESIIDGIDSACGMILIISQHSNTSPQVRREVERAVSKGIIIIPMIMEELELSKWMQYYISAHQWNDEIDIPLEDRLPRLLEVLGPVSYQKNAEPDLSDLSSLLEKDLERLSLALDTDGGETKALLPGERRRVSILHLRTELLTMKLAEPALKTISETIENLVSRFLGAYGGCLEEMTRSDYRCVFGMDKALEDDCRRALSCGIRLFNAFSELNAVLRKKDMSIDFGLGVTAGMLEVKETDSDHPEVIGDVLESASHLAEQASNELLSEKSVYRMCLDQFSWEEQPGSIYRVADYSLSGTETKVLNIRSPFVGREEELAKLNSLLDKQKQGTEKKRRGGFKHLVMGIKGEAGIGKTRLVHEFIEVSCKVDEEILVLRGQTLSYAQPSYWLWTTLLQYLLDIELGSGLAYEEFLERLRELSDDEELINSAPFLSELLSIPSGDRRLEELDNKAIALDTRLALRNLLRALSSDKRLVVVLEDMHWLDVADRTVLEFIVSNCDALRPIVFLLLYRPEREDGSAVSFDIHANFAVVEESQIAEVDEDKSFQLVRELLQEISKKESGNIAPEASRFLLDHAKGIPFYLEELVLDLVESGTLSEHGGEWTFRKPLKEILVPESLTALIQSRLDKLPDAWRDVLNISSVLGMEFQLKLYQKLADRLLLGRPRMATFDGLERKQMLMSEVSAFDRKYLFRHMLVHDAAYSSILNENLPKLHRAAAESIEELYEGESEQISGILTYHWEKAGDIYRAFKWGIMALEYAVKCYSNDEALRLSHQLEAWLVEYPECKEKSDMHFRVLCSYNKVLGILGRRDDQESTLIRMLTIANDLEDTKWKYVASNEYGNYLRLTGQLNKAHSYYCIALEQAQISDNTHYIAQTYANLGYVYVKQNRLQEAITTLEAANSILNSINCSGRVQMQTQNTMSIIYRNNEEYNHAYKALYNALEIARSTGARRHEASTLANIGIFQLDESRYRDAYSNIAAAIRIAQDIGDITGVGVYSGYLGSTCYYMDRNEEARELYETALQIHREVRNRRFEGKVLNDIGELNVEECRLDEAARCFENALRIQRETGNRQQEGITLGNMGNMLRVQGRIDDAHEKYSMAIKIHHELGNRRYERSVCCKIGLLYCEAGYAKKALKEYHKVCKMLSGICQGRTDLGEGFIELHRELLLSGYSESEVPWPAHWNPPELDLKADEQQ